MRTGRSSATGSASARTASGNPISPRATTRPTARPKQVHPKRRRTRDAGYEPGIELAVTIVAVLMWYFI
jgi:hypothetical protein